MKDIYDEKAIESMIDYLYDIIKNAENFKIGKTGKPIEQRYKEEYQNDYKHYKEIYASTDSLLIDYLEESLIKFFKGHPDCDNQQAGSGEMTDESGIYRVYVVRN